MKSIATLHLVAMVAATTVRAQTFNTIETPMTLGHTVSRILATRFKAKKNKKKVFYALSPFNFLAPELGPEDRPENAIYRISKPIEAMKGTAEPKSEIVLGDETTITFPVNIEEAPPKMRHIFGNGAKPLCVSTGRFRVANFDFQPGQLLLLDPQSQDVIPISGNLTRWIYGRTVFKDVDGDGLLDILAVRMADHNVDPATNTFVYAGQLVWFKQPKKAKTARAGDWEEHILLNAEEATNEGHPTNDFDFQDIDKDGVEELVAVDFWGGFVRLYYLEGSTSWADASSIRSFDLVSAAIDPSFGFAYDVHFGDLNNDGKMDVYATSHVLSIDGVSSVVPFQKPQLAAFELADDWKNSRGFTKHVIDDTFGWRQANALSTGFANHFYIPTEGSETTLKPWVVNAGDGSGEWYLYKPTSEDSSDWTYEKIVLHSNANADFIAPEFVETKPEARVKMIVCGALQVGAIYGISINAAE